jgi:hypothetical protein
MNANNCSLLAKSKYVVEVTSTASIIIAFYVWPNMTLMLYSLGEEGNS